MFPPKRFAVSPPNWLDALLIILEGLDAFRFSFLKISYCMVTLFPSIFSAFFPSGWCFFYLVTTGWIFDISLCENSLKKSKTYSKSMDQPGKVANPARGQLNREDEYSPVRVRA